MDGRIYVTIYRTTHHHGIRNWRLPTVVERPEAASIMVDGAIYGTIYPVIYGTIRFLDPGCFLEGCSPSAAPLAVLTNIKAIKV